MRPLDIIYCEISQLSNSVYFNADEFHSRQKPTNNDNPNRSRHLFLGVVMILSSELSANSQSNLAKFKLKQSPVRIARCMNENALNRFGQNE